MKRVDISTEEIRFDKKKRKQSEVEYTITIETAKAYGGSGGKDNVVHIELTGEDGAVTGPIQLNGLWSDHFSRGKTDVFKKSAVNVGLPVLVRLDVGKTESKDPWAVRVVKVWFRDRKAVFPVHDWVQTELSITTGEAATYQKVHNPYVMSVLKRELECARMRLPWVRRPGPTDPFRSLPRYIDDVAMKEVPLIFQQTEQWKLSIAANTVYDLYKYFTTVFTEIFFPISSLDCYHRLYKDFEKPGHRAEFLDSDRWMTDEEYGRQQLNGIAAASLERCTEIPETSQITDARVPAYLLGEQTLSEEMKAGKVYMTDFTTIVRNVKRNKDKHGNPLYCPNSICLYHVNGKDDLVPIAIQLVPEDPMTIFTPADSKMDWLLAKMYHKVAFGCIHEWYYHFLVTHGVMESFAVAVFRNLPRSHPIYKLLKPHLQTVTEINVQARKHLLPPGSFPNKAIALEGEDTAREMFKTFNMEDLKIPELLKRRGLDDPKLLPKFYFRDDATKLWEIIEHFASTVIQHFYRTEEDIVADRFLQDMMEDIATEGIGWGDEKHHKGLPYPLRTVDQLVQLCTSVIFTSSANHSSVNFPQYDQYKYIPNSPPSMLQPPHHKGEGTMDRILKSLPDAATSMIVISLTSTLSTYAPDEIFLGDYPDKLFVDKEAKEAMRKFRRQLDKYGEDVTKRNSEVQYPYEWLLPEKIARSISI